MITPTTTAAANKEENQLVGLISEIIQGFSTIQWGKKELFIKHHSLTDQARVIVDAQQKKDEAVRKGIPTEQEAIEQAIERGDWTQKDEQFVSSVKDKISALSNAASQMRISSQRKTQELTIEELKKELKNKEEDRLILIENTAEVVGNFRAYNEFLSNLLFVDKDFTKKVEDLEEINNQTFLKLQALQRETYAKFDDFSISKAVLSDFFRPMLSFTDDPNKIFGKSISEITLFQMKLLSYGYMFHMIFKNTPDIPEFIRKDPEALIDFVDQKQNDVKTGKNKAESRKSQKGAVTYFGADKTDIQKLRDKNERVVDFNEELKKRGGKMNMQQMIELCGVDEK